MNKYIRIHPTVSPYECKQHQFFQQSTLDNSSEEKHNAAYEIKVEVNGMSDGDADSENESDEQDGDQARSTDDKAADKSQDADQGTEEVLPP